MQLTPRLEVIAKQVTPRATIADIGTDHAYIPIYLVENNISTNIYACDINKGPLDIAKKQIRKYGYEEDITTLLGAGLDPIKGLAIQNIIIAGMGGILIKDIIDKNKEIAQSAEKLILQPMIAQEELRQYLIMNGFTIIHEDLAQEDRRIYQIIVAKKGTSKSWDEIHYHLSQKLIENDHPLLGNLMDAKENELKKIIQACDQQQSEHAIQRSKECKTLLEKLMEVKECL